MSFQYFSELDGESKRRYREKLQLMGSDECPYRIPADSWIDNVLKWPNLEYPDLCDYLMDTPGIYTKEAMKNRRSLEAYNQFISGFVGPVLFVKTKTNNFVMKAEVKPSQRVNDDSHCPWMAVSPEGQIICAHCNCMAGLGESCMHIASIGFKVEAAVRMGYTSETCTDKVCVWNNDFVKKVKAKPIVDIQFYKKITGRVKSCRRNFSEATQSQKNDFLSKLKALPTDSQPVGLSLFAGYADGFHQKTSHVPKCTARLPPSLRTYHVPNILDDDIGNKVESILNLKLSHEQRTFINDSTKLQSLSLVWKEMRVGRITASVVHEVLHTDQTYPSISVMKKICFPPSNELNIPAVKWGKENEKRAVETYQEGIRAQHENLVLRQAGLQISESHHFLAASTDAVANCNCHGDWLVEVKCPFRHKDAQTVEDILSDSDFYVNTDGQLKSDHKYMSQVQMQMFVYGLNCCHFVVWTPNVCFGIAVPYDPSFEVCIDKLVSFYQSNIAPELVTRRLEMGVNDPIQQVVEDIESTETIYCYCRQPYNENEEMIGCDNDQCSYKWIHFSCARIKRAPKGRWYCKYCRRNKQCEDLY